MSNEEIHNRKKTSLCTLCAYFLVIIFLLFLPFKLISVYNDIERIMESSFMVLCITSLIGLLLSLPVVFSIALLKRNNWARVGIMILLILIVFVNCYFIFMTQTFYPRQIIWIVFLVVVFLILKSERCKQECTEIKL